MEKDITEKMTGSGTDLSVLPEKRCYTVQDLMEMLQISKPTALKLIREQTEKEGFHAFQIGSSRAWRISKKSFDAWLDGQTEGNDT